MVNDMWEHIARDFIILFVTIDPIGTLSLFLAVTASVPADERKRIAVRCTAYSAAILVGFIVGGQFLLSGLGIHLVSFQIAGGIILFLFGLQMVFGSGTEHTGGRPEPHHDIAVFPLAIPSIASPGAIMAVVLLTDNHRFSITEQSITTAVLIVVLGITLVALLLANPIHRVIGRGGANILIRVMGLILASLAVEKVLEAISQLFTDRWTL